jgi:hypothetical protein
MMCKERERVSAVESVGILFENHRYMYIFSPPPFNRAWNWGSCMKNAPC